MENYILNDTSEKYTAHIDTNIELKPHQLSALYRCIEMENKCCVENIHKYDYIKTNIGILGDLPGSGKSYIMLALIKVNQIPKVRLKNVFTYMNQISFKYQTQTNFHFQNTNIIVCPVSCVPQWITYITKFYKNTVSYISVVRKNYFDTFKKNEGKYDIVVVSSTNYSRVASYYNEHRIKVDRVIFDEADNANTPGAKKIEACFYWVLSATYENIFYPFPRYETYYDDFGCRKYYTISSGILQNIFIKDIFLTILKLNEDDTSIIHSSILVKNDDKYVQESFKLPPMIKQIIVCREPVILNVLNGITSENIIKCLNAGDMNSAIKELKLQNINTEEHIIDIIMKQLKNDIMNKKLLHNCTESMFFQTVKQKTEKLNDISTDIDKMETQLQTLQERIKNNAMCNICYMEIDDGKMITDCCKNCFCMKCVVKWGQYQNTCPLCRFSPLNIQKMYVIRKEHNPNENNIDDIMDKFQEFEKMIRQMDKEKKKVLVFAEYRETLEKIDNVLKKNSIKCSTLDLRGIKKKIEEYKSSTDCNILLINSVQLGSGINLENTTDVILFHKFDTALEKQVIGRAHRPGREIQLKIWYLLNQNELGRDE